MRLLLAFIVLAVLTGPASAEPVQLQYFDLPPFSFEQEGQPSGTALILAQSVSAGLDIVLHPELVPEEMAEILARSSPPRFGKEPWRR